MLGGHRCDALLDLAEWEIERVKAARVNVASVTHPEIIPPT
jgi:hypothetical protein